jgi:hypothetical protein
MFLKIVIPLDFRWEASPDKSVNQGWNFRKNDVVNGDTLQWDKNYEAGFKWIL